MFRPNWPSSGVQVVVTESAAHCNAVFFPPVLVASGYLVISSFYLVVLLLVLFGLLVVAALNVLAETGVLLYVGRPS
jgi:diacylglycerol kinase